MTEEDEIACPKMSLAIYLVDRERVSGLLTQKEKNDARKRAGKKLTTGVLDADSTMYAILEKLRTNYSGDDSENRTDESETNAPTSISNEFFREIEKDGIVGAVYRTKTTSSAKKFLLPLLEDRTPVEQTALLEDSDEGSTNDNTGPSQESAIFENHSVGFVLMRKVGQRIFLLSGGSAHKHISYFVDTRFGMDFLPKLFKKNDAVMFGRTRHHVMGEVATESNTTRSEHPLTEGTLVGSLTKSCNVSVDEAHLNELGLPGHDKSIARVTETAFKLKERASLTDFGNIIDRIAEILHRKPDFLINCMTEIKPNTSSTKIDKEISLIVDRQELDNALYIELDKAFRLHLKENGENTSIPFDCGHICEIELLDVELLFNVVSYEVHYQKGSKRSPVKGKGVPYLSKIISQALRDRPDDEVERATLDKLLEETFLVLKDDNGEVLDSDRLRKSLQATLKHKTVQKKGKKTTSCDID